MAGPLSSEEIEDVVSSVRRLVSNEQRIKTRDLNAERLVLTSAYRVVPEASPLAAPLSPTLSPLMLDASLVEAAAQIDVPPMVVGDAVLQATVDPVDALEDSLAQALDVEVDADLVVQPDHDLAAPDAALTDMVEAEWEDEIWAEPGQVTLGEAALAAEEAEVLMAPEPELDVNQPATSDVGDGLAADDRGSASADEPIPFVPLRRRAEDLAARVAAGAVVELPGSGAALESQDPDPAISEPIPDHPEPALDVTEPVQESPEPAAADASPMSPAADATPKAPTDVAASPVVGLPHVATDLYDTDGTPLAVLDETALNEIVRQVLRAELQGELGERITRNVRKLVRAEINRALMARDLD